MIANVADLGEAANVELCRTELRHVGDAVVVMACLPKVDEHTMRFAMTGAGGQKRQAEPRDSLAARSPSITPQSPFDAPTLIYGTQIQYVGIPEPLAQLPVLGGSNRERPPLWTSNLYFEPQPRPCPYRRPYRAT